MIIKKLIFMLVIFLASTNIYTQTKWDLAKNEDGIKVYLREEQGTEYKAFKANMMVSSSIGEMMPILKDIENYNKWFAYTETSHLIKIENGRQYNYVETKFPWPYKNRDMVYEMDIQQIDESIVKVSIIGIPDFINEKEGIVRMQKAGGYILLKALEDKTEIIYYFHSEPGNSIPAWVANISIIELPFITLSGLRDILQNK